MIKKLVNKIKGISDIPVLAVVARHNEWEAFYKWIKKEINPDRLKNGLKKINKIEAAKCFKILKCFDINRKRGQ